METQTQLQKIDLQGESTFSIQGFEHAQRIAKALSEASLVPDAYKKSISNCLIAIEFANRMGASPLMVMQNLHVIKGKPGWSSPFIIASINTCGRFTKLNWIKSGEGDNYGYEAVAKDKKTGEELVGTKVTRKMVREEGWLAKEGSKWKTMEEQMFHYRSAAFWSRLHAPELLMGMQTVEEVLDVQATVVDTKQDEEFERIHKEDERLKALIQQATSKEKLESLREHCKTDDQLELFKTKERALS